MTIVTVYLSLILKEEGETDLINEEQRLKQSCENQSVFTGPDTRGQ